MRCMYCGTSTIVIVSAFDVKTWATVRTRQCLNAHTFETREILPKFSNRVHERVQTWQRNLTIYQSGKRLRDLVRQYKLTRVRICQIRNEKALEEGYLQDFFKAGNLKFRPRERKLNEIPKLTFPKSKHSKAVDDNS